MYKTHTLEEYNEAMKLRRQFGWGAKKTVILSGKGSDFQEAFDDVNSRIIKGSFEEAYKF